jgi:tRNA pseudouridine38-40 synthase
MYISYNGKNYHGWQIQPNGISVQEILEKALTTLLRNLTTVVGAGRTDAGVHAREMIAHVDFNEAIADAEHFIYKLNSLLPNDIAIHRILPVCADAHARFDAVSRSYEYWLTSEKDPFLYDWAARVPGELDFEVMNRAARLLFHYSDFTSFSKLHSDAKTNNCTISNARWQQRDNVWIFSITADRFLRNMVRAIVGTLLEVGRGKLSEDDFRSIIEARNRCRAGVSVPAKGLYLTKVEYNEDIFFVKK